MIIITGADNTGKSTLANHLSNKFGIDILERYHKLPPDNYDDWYRFIVKGIDSESELIADRFYIDELVYGPIVRGKIGLTAHQITMMNILVAEEKPLIILCHRNVDNILSSFGDRDQYIEPSNVSKIQNKYFEVTSDKPFRDLTIGYCIEDDQYYDKIDFQVQMYLKQKEVAKNERK